MRELAEKERRNTRDLSHIITARSGGGLPTLYLAFTDSYGEIVHDPDI